MSHIVFKKVKWKNFLATGDNFTEIDLNRTSNTLVVGTNGSGKSTLLDAISFSLFGKAHRDTKKPLLINSINKKRCVVEIEFTVGGVEYRIMRGIKPAKFEIYKDGELLNQSSATKDYQKILEQNILKMNYKSFHQIVVLGSSNFIPFMKLPAHHRREVIEDLLDIQIFSKMSILVKAQIQQNKENVKEINNAIKLTKNNIDLKEKHLKEIDNMSGVWLKSKEDEIQNINRKVELTMSSIDTTDYSDKLNELSVDVKNLIEERSKLQMQKSNLSFRVQDYDEKAKVFIGNSKCYTCQQIIDEDHKSKMLHGFKDAAEHFNNEVDIVEDNIDQLSKKIIEYNEQLCNIKDTQIRNNEVMAELQRYQKEHVKLSKEVEGLKQNNDEKIINLKEDVDKHQDLLNRLNDKRSTLIEEGLYHISIAEMLKDTGIKTKVIKQYLPVINTTINKYLSVLDFFVQFNLDENFNETLLSRHRDNFIYSSFSEGEKARIDLALLFTWRQIARMRNSSSTNLLILDETFDSSMDTDGLDNLMKILDTLPEGTNTFIISHKIDQLEGKFRSTIKFDKIKNFSKMV